VEHVPLVSSAFATLVALAKLAKLVALVSSAFVALVEIVIVIVIVRWHGHSIAPGSRRGPTGAARIVR
jgi:hypothetical protein